MNKKLKIFFLVAIVVILAGASYILYEFKIKVYDVADEEVDGILDEPYKLELPDGTVIEEEDNDTEAKLGDRLDSGSTDSAEGSTESTGRGDTTNASETLPDSAGKDSGSKSEGTTSPGKTAVNANNGQTSYTNQSGQSSFSSQTSQSGENGSTSDKSTKFQTGSDVSVSSIKARYKPTLQGLEDQAAGRLNSLVGRAKSEYAEKNKTGDVSYGYFYNKYMGAAKSMEAQTDGAFNSVMNALENELKANGYDKSYAKSFRTDYEARKKNLRTELMNKALGR